MMKRIKNKDNKKVFTLKETLTITIISCFVTFATVGVVLFNSYEHTARISYNKLALDKDLQEFLEVYSSVTEDYYEDIDKKELLSTAMDAMLDYLGEDYTTYLNSSENSIIESQLNGKYNGIGIMINNENVISRVFNDSPAKKAGLLENDKILKVDDKEFEENSSAEIASYIRSKKDEKIRIIVLRGEEEIALELTPSTLDMPVVNTQIIESDSKKIGYMGMTSFSESLTDQVIDGLNELKKENVNNLIIDLRNNTGGYLTSAKSVANLFIEKDKIIFSMKGKNIEAVYKDETEEKTDYKIIVLVNEYTASAAEILSAALKESYGAILVGQKTYGKGKVQQLMNLSEGTAVKYTTAKWYTPNGTCIDKVGITPDYEVENEYNEETKEYKDNQLSKALELFNN